MLLVRGEKVMLDVDLATLYGVSTKALNQAFRRNKNRFPDDFVFQLTREELKLMRSQIVTTSENAQAMRSQIVTTSQKYRRSDSLPFAFTEQGVAMLSSVLRSKRAVITNIAIMRAFVAVRNWMQSSKELAAKIRQLEKKYDQSFKINFFKGGGKNNTISLGYFSLE